MRANISSMHERLRELVDETEAQQRQGARAVTPLEKEALSKAKLILMGVRGWHSQCWCWWERVGGMVVLC